MYLKLQPNTFQTPSKIYDLRSANSIKKASIDSKFL